MPRNRSRKTNIGLHTKEQMQHALELINNENRSIRSAAELTGIPFATLRRYYHKQKDSDGSAIRLTPNYEVRRIFSVEEEQSLVDYIIKCSQMFYGLTRQEVQQLAYEMALTNAINIPQKWHEKKCAGKEWLYNFRKRHTNVSLRTPEGCSLSRATSFNRHNVEIFYVKLKEVMSRNPNIADGTRIYNLDETGTTTVQKSQKVLAVKGQKQICKVTSAERGILVTTCCIVNSAGTFLPPVMVFPRTHFKQHMLNGAPPGSLGLANPSGWMNSELFVETMKHFIKHSQSSQENPCLLIMDNYEAHISINVINLAKENGVTILTVPPHSTGKMQPLDVGLFKPFKTAYNAAVDSWMMRHPGKPISIYEIAACVGEAHMKAMTPINIMNAFRKTGIFPYDNNIFTDIDFLPSEVTNRPLLTEIHQNVSIQNAPSVEQQRLNSIEASTSEAATKKEFLSPEQFRGFPVAGPRKGRKQRRKGKSMIATDTPEKMEIEEREMAKRAKRAKVAKRKVLEEEVETTDEDDYSVHSDEDSDEQHDENVISLESLKPMETFPSVDEFVLVEFKAKERRVYYVAKVLSVSVDDFEVEVSFFRKSNKMMNTFHLPNVPDISKVSLSDIKMVLPQATLCGNTKRQQSFYKFNLDFSEIDLR